MKSLACAASVNEKSHMLLLAWTLLLVTASSGWLAEAGLTNREPYTEGMLNATQPAKWDATGKFAIATGAVDVNVYGWIQCYADAVLVPSTTDETAAGIAGVVAAAIAGNGAPPKIRATTSHYHSLTAFPCPHAYGGSLGSPMPPNYGPIFVAPGTSSATPTTAALLIDALRGVTAFDAASQTLTVLSGSRLWQVWAWAAERNLSPSRGVPTVWADLSVGGVIATSAHGNGGPDRPSALNDIAIEYTWVDANGNVRRSLRNSPEGRAISGGLGVIGVVTEVKLQFEPLSKTAAFTLSAKPDTNMASEVAALQLAAGQAASVALLWRPDLGKYNAYVLADAGNATALAALASAAGGDADSIKGKIAELLESATTGTGGTFSGALPPGGKELIAAFISKAQADANDTAVSAVPLDAAACVAGLGSQLLQQWAATAHGVVPLPVGVGVTNFVTSAWLPPDRVAWSGPDGVAIDEISFAFESDHFAAWVEDVKKIIAMELGGGKVRCAPLGYMLPRFGSISDDDTSLTSGLSKPVMISYALLRSQALPDVPAKYSWIQEAVEQMTLCKYRGRPHWGKNFARTFTNPDCPVRDLYPKFDDLLNQQAANDPNKVFEPPTFSAVVARSGPLSTEPRCALRKLCYCTTDDQCAIGWVCKPGKAFPEYNLCVPAGLKWGN